MKYEDALMLCKAKQNLVGTKGEKGDVIGAVVMVPSDSQAAEVFWRRYVLSSYDSVSALVPYVGMDMRVVAVDLYHLEKEGVLFFRDITNE